MLKISNKEPSVGVLPTNGGVVIQVKYPTRFLLCSSFMRIQEFYDSPYPEIRGKHFSPEEYMDRAAEETGNFTYFLDHVGFNIPGEVFRAWGSVYPMGSRTAKEHTLYRAVLDAYTDTALARGLLGKDTSFYVLGVFEDCPDYERVVNHEMAHALYHLDMEYRQKVRSILVDKDITYALATVTQKLRKEGILEEKMEDEVNAYLSTSSGSGLFNAFGVQNPVPDLEGFYLKALQRNHIPYLTPVSLDELESRSLAYHRKYGYGAGKGGLL